MQDDPVFARQRRSPSAETRRKMREAHTGLQHSAETKQKIAAASAEQQRRRHVIVEPGPRYRGVQPVVYAKPR